MSLKAVEFAMFEWVFGLATAAMEGSLAPGSIPTMVGKAMRIQVAPNKVETIEFQNHPVVRLMDVVASQVPTQDDRVSVAARIYHLYEMFTKDEMKPYLRFDEGQAMVSNAVLAVAATHPIDPINGFAPGFFEAVQVAMSPPET